MQKVLQESFFNVYIVPSDDDLVNTTVLGFGLMYRKLLFHRINDTLSSTLNQFSFRHGFKFKPRFTPIEGLYYSIQWTTYGKTYLCCYKVLNNEHLLTKSDSTAMNY